MSASHQKGLHASPRQRAPRLVPELPAREAEALRSELKALQAARRLALELLDEMHEEYEEYEERVERGLEAIRARTSRSPWTRRESPEEARRRLGLPPR